MGDDPRTLIEAVKYFADLDVARDFLVSLRWPEGVACPTCGRKDVRYIVTRRLWECKEKHPKRQFSARVGAIFEDSPLGLDRWFAGIWMIANCKNGASSYEFSRAAGITQKSSWFLLHRIRLAMKAGSIMKFEGEIEADESFIGGSPRTCTPIGASAQSKEPVGLAKPLSWAYFAGRGRVARARSRPLTPVDRQ